MKSNLVVSVVCESYIGFVRIGAQPTKNGESQMTNFKTLSAVIIFCATVATPVFAQDADTLGPQAAPARHVRAHDRSNYRGAYNQSNEPFYAAPSTQDRVNMENFGFSGRDPSRVGGEDPDLNPPN